MDKRGKIVLPVDILSTDSIENPTRIDIYPYDDMPDDMIGVDIGPDTVRIFAEAVRNSGTTVLTGPMGIFENPKFAKGTKGILDAMVELTDKGGTTVVGGGDTVSATKKLIDEHLLSHVSTGGGASLNVMEGMRFEAVLALTDKE
jgi:phosphoglycerate kinase